MFMPTTSQLQFIQQKITEINSAIFFNLSDAVLKLPTTVVSTLKVDDYGYAWFIVKKPKQNLDAFETEFPVRLDYYKKGKEAFLQIMGKASLVNDPEEINMFIASTPSASIHDLQDAVLVKVKMMKADYQENASRHGTSIWAQAKYYFFTWFRSGEYGPATFIHSTAA